MAITTVAQFNIGQAVRHRHFDFGGIVEDVDPVFAETEAWYAAIPAESRPDRNQPFYRVRCDVDGERTLAYVSQQNLAADTTGEFTSIAHQAAALCEAKETRSQLN